MLIVTSNDSSGEETGCMGNRPEERKRMVKAALEEAGFRSVVVSTPDVDLALAECVHSKELLSFLEHAWSNWSSLWIASKNNRGYLVPYGVTQKDSDEPPGLVPCYVAPRDGLQRASKTVIGAIAMFGLDRETPITHLTYSQLCLDMAILRNCIDHVCSGAQPSVLYAQVTHPGHHAGRDFYGGFCFLNNAAIVAHQLKTRLKKRIAILDVDYHAGNGTESIFYKDGEVLMISLHADPDLEYPFNSCYPDQTGADEGAGTTLNIVMPVHTTWKEYKEHLAVALNRIASFDPGAIVVSLGLDTLSQDPVAFPTATFDLFAQDFGEMGAMILADERFAKLPKVFLQEGGYKLEEVTKGVLNFFTQKS